MTKVTTEEVILLGDLEVAIVRSTRRKRLSLEVGSRGIMARAPQRMRYKTIEQFVFSKRDWIQRHAQNQPPPVKPVELKQGTQLSFLNEDITLNLVINKRGAAQLINDRLDLPVIQSKRPLEATIKDKLIRWYKQQALTCLRDKVAFYADDMQIPLPDSMNVKVRDYKRRWGSCDHKGDLSFNWRIIMAPENTIDYVVVHELAHLKEFNHSARFWSIVAQQMPNWKKHQQWLHTNGGALYCI